MVSIRRGPGLDAIFISVNYRFFTSAVLTSVLLYLSVFSHKTSNLQGFNSSRLDEGIGTGSSVKGTNQRTWWYNNHIMSCIQRIVSLLIACPDGFITIVWCAHHQIEHIYKKKLPWNDTFNKSRSREYLIF